MARHTRRLTDLKVKSLKQPGLHIDGDGLYLRITDSGTKSWIFRFRLGGRLRDMGLGKYPTVGLAGAREMATETYALVRRGIDPIEMRKEQSASAPEAKRVMTFDLTVEQFLDDREGGWKNAKHRQQWRNTLNTYASPVMGGKDVADILTEDVLKILKPIWQSKAETASRVRGRIENVLDWAKVNKFRSGENPAAWRGHLAHILPARNKKRTVRHHPAMPFAEVPEFMAELRANGSASAKALALTILCALRTSEVIEGVWEEFDVESRLWDHRAMRQSW